MRIKGHLGIKYQILIISLKLLIRNESVWIKLNKSSKLSIKFY